MNIKQYEKEINALGKFSFETVMWFNAINVKAIFTKIEIRIIGSPLVILRNDTATVRISSLKSIRKTADGYIFEYEDDLHTDTPMIKEAMVKAVA